MKNKLIKATTINFDQLYTCLLNFTCNYIRFINLVNKYRCIPAETLAICVMSEAMGTVNAARANRVDVVPIPVAAGDDRVGVVIGAVGVEGVN